MWKLEVLVKNIPSQRIVSKDVFEGFNTRLDAEEKILEYFDIQRKTKDNVYMFYLISPWGNVFPVDPFGATYLDMHLIHNLLII